MLRYSPALFDCVFLQEEPVDFLKGQIRRFGVAEVHKGNECKVQAHENQVPFPSEVGKKRWCYHHNDCNECQHQAI